MLSGYKALRKQNDRAEDAERNGAVHIWRDSQRYGMREIVGKAAAQLGEIVRSGNAAGGRLPQSP